MNNLNVFIAALLAEWTGDCLPNRPITEHRCYECDETDRLLGGRSWQEVLNDFPSYCHDVFPLLTAEAKKYYLPAFMGTAIRNTGDESVSVQSYLESNEFQSNDYTSGQLMTISQWVNHQLNPEFDQKSINIIMRKVVP